MKINLETIDIQHTDALTEYVNEKVSKLDKYLDSIVAADVTLKKTQDSEDTHMAEVRLNVPGETLFASSTGESAGKALGDAVDALKRQIKKYKEKLSTY